MDYENSFFVNNIDEFDDDDLIVSKYPRNPFDDDGADNIFGLGNKQKKAERKLAKAEKKLAKGQTKKAEKKISKAQKLLGQIQKGVEKNQPAIQAALAQSQGITSATSPAQTESLQTEPGQIGAAAEPPVLQPQSSVGGGGGGDMSMDTGFTPDTTMSDVTPETTALSTPDNPVTLPDVTVTATKGNKTILLIVIGALVLLAIWYFSKKGKKL